MYYKKLHLANPVNEALIDILFKTYRRQVLTLLLLNPEQKYHVREIARLTGTVAGTVNKELSKLAQAGILFKAQQGNQILYAANESCEIYQELVSILQKTQKSSTTKPPNQKTNEVEKAFIFNMLQAIEDVVTKVDNKIQLSRSNELQKLVVKQLDSLLCSSRQLSDRESFTLHDIETIMRVGSKMDLESTWKVIKQDLPLIKRELQQHLKRAMNV